MPTYDYECDGCGHRFETLQGFSEEPLKKCPECKKKKLRRLFGTGAAVLFKGAGFYETDYRSESYQAAAKKDAEAATTPAPASTPAADTSAAPSKTEAPKPAKAAKAAKPKASGD